MIANEKCVACFTTKAKKRIYNTDWTEEKKDRIWKESMEAIEPLIGIESSPVMSAMLSGIAGKYMDINAGYQLAKEKYNAILLEKEQEFLKHVEEGEDPLLTAVQYALIGNYIDFGAMADVNEEKLNELLQESDHLAIQGREFENFRKELADSKNMVYITDNAGEIVMDKILVETIQKLYPDLQVTVMVRDEPILNDATMEDAEFVGMTKIADVITNGVRVPGTPMHRISEEARRAIKDADFCIAKGQGNFETMSGSGENIYYLFLCKCDMFVERFGLERFAPVLKNEKR